MRYLLDTCMLVALLQRELGSERIREKILLAPSGSLAISAISAAEIWRGIGQSRHSKAAKLAFDRAHGSVDRRTRPRPRPGVRD